MSSVFDSPLVFLLAWYGTALLVSASLVPLCRAAALRYGYVARPREDRWHRRPTAMLGGVAIAATALALAVVTGDVWRLALPLAGGLIFALGVADDILSLKPSTKLIAEIVVASGFVFFGHRLQLTDLQTVDTLLTIVWLVGVTNAFNLLDNMDGLCAGIALIAGTALLAGLAGRSDLVPEMRYLAIVLGATSGFLIYNIHPASIFMGDGGSLFLGLTLAALALGPGSAEFDRSQVLSIVAAPVLVLLIPIVDTTLVTVSRLLSGRPVSQGGRDHSSHRLVAIGLSERTAVNVLWVLAAAAGAIGSAVQRFSNDWAWLLGTTFILSTVLFAVYLAQVRVYEPRTLPVRGVTPLVADFMYKRRVAEVLLDACLVTISYYAAWRLRFEGPDWQGYAGKFIESLPIALAAQLVCLFIFGAYRGAWRHFSLMDGVVFGKAVAAGTVSQIMIVLYGYRFENYSRGVFIIHAALLMLMLCASRASFRLIGEFAGRRRSGALRLVIYGAGEAGSLLVRELMAGQHSRYRILGFIDDDPAKRRLRLQGYSVLGAEWDLAQLIRQGGVDVVVLGSRFLDGARMMRIESLCRRHDVKLLRFSLELETLVSTA
jgi:UDP-GlcNAc:undecaprenyl-phosphate GlcNAc-1-phosphate transferase